jgi:hypothetical protein
MLLYWTLFNTMPLAIAGLVVALVAALVLAIRKQKGRKAWLTFTALPLGCGCAPMLVVGAMIAIPTLYWAFRSAISDYEEVFGAAPVPAIMNLMGQTDVGMDGRRIYLAFTRSQAALAEMQKLTSKASGPQNSDILDGNGQSKSAPAWWHGHSRLGEKGCDDLTQKGYEDFGYWRNLIIADCPSRNTIFVLASRRD